jgi:hypothetical protein
MCAKQGSLTASSSLLESPIFPSAPEGRGADGVDAMA